MWTKRPAVLCRGPVTPRPGRPRRFPRLKPCGSGCETISWPIRRTQHRHATAARRHRKQTLRRLHPIGLFLKNLHICHWNPSSRCSISTAALEKGEGAICVCDEKDIALSGLMHRFLAHGSPGRSPGTSSRSPGKGDTPAERRQSPYAASEPRCGIEQPVEKRASTTFTNGKGAFVCSAGALACGFLAAGGGCPTLSTGCWRCSVKVPRFTFGFASFQRRRGCGRMACSEVVITPSSAFSPPSPPPRGWNATGICFPLQCEAAQSC